MSGSAEASGERSIAAGSIRQALTGDFAVAHYVEKSLTLPPEALELPPRAPSGMVNLPERARLFIGRQPELARLDEAFEDTGGVVVQAVHGLGGIGKSTLAAKWAAGRTGAYNPVWWITAETPDDLEAGLADLAVALQPALRDVLSPEARSERAVQWLAERDGWLLVLDNVTDPADVRPLLGRTTGGRFLITTRRASGWHGIAEPLSLDVLELPQAVELFERIYAGTADGIEELCGTLGCLPLAVEQAAAYCAEARITPSAYRDLLARHPERILANTAEGGDAEQTIARVWRVTMDRLADTPVAARILRVIAWWAPDGIPRAYVESLGDEPDVREALRRLAAHSMIGLREDGTISVHRLVQAVSRAGEDGAEGHAEAVRVLLEEAWNAMDRPLVREWNLQVIALLQHDSELGIPRDFEVLLYIGAADLMGTEVPEKVLWAYEYAVTLCEQHHLGRTPTARLAQRRLSDICWLAGDQHRAEVLLMTSVMVARRVLGRDDPRTIDERTALAKVRMRQERTLKQGLSLAVKNARWAERALGADAPQTLRAGAVVAEGWRLRAESRPRPYAARAVAEIERLLDKAVRAEGECGDTALAHRWELGAAREAAGDLAGAIRVTEEYLEQRSAPSDGVDTQGLKARQRIAVLFWKAGEHERARELAVALLAEVESALPADDDLGGRLREALTPLVGLPPDDET
ncbi:NB-ARC domain-containing protein [Streptomyces sp. NPDC056464]|uniref:NB-ARC domain-containing protein n=1 Tax=Streptomyces sp. NPDC056464 TaxID=3345828 RepID=UPI0036C4AAE3